MRGVNPERTRRSAGSSLGRSAMGYGVCIFMDGQNARPYRTSWPLYSAFGRG